MKEKQKGILYIITAAFFFSLMTLFVRLSGDLPTMQKALFRNLVAMVLSWGMLLYSREKIEIGKENLVDLLLRAVCGTVGLICNFYAIDRLNISDANMLNKLSPFFAILMSGFILKEKAKKEEWLAVFIAFAGALLVIKPGFSMHAGPAFMGALGGFGAGVAYTFVRKLSKNGVKGSVIVLFFSTFSTIVTLPGFVLSYQPMTWKQLTYLLLAGAAATGGQLAITAAYAYAPAKEISVFDYIQVIFAAIWGFLVLGQVPDVFSFIGYGIIILAAVTRVLPEKTSEIKK
ncbi:MAG: DMT family transporter [Lachnospiraceae bacterium]|nr:DMT family transporter [Lachnospiraceae bacterium]